MRDSFRTITYHICVRGQIPESWKDAFADLRMDFGRDECGVLTHIYNKFSDPSALQGLLNNLYMLGLVLISVDCQNECPVNSGQQDLDAQVT